MFVIKASTPEAMRDEIVKWLNQQASNHRIAANKLKGMHATTVELAKAQTYEGAAKFLESCTVEVSAANEMYSCPCGVGSEPCPDASGKPLCVTKS